MKRFSWNDIVRAELVDELAGFIGLTLNQSQRLSALNALVAIAVKTGGLPVTETPWDSAKQKQIVWQLISESLRHFLTLCGASPAYGDGYRRISSQSTDWEQDIEPCERVPINVADADALEQLPGIGSQLAQAIVDERRLNGPFHSRESLADRVNGIGENTLQAIRSCISLRDPVAHLRALNKNAKLEQDLAACMRQVANNIDASAFVLTLDQVAIEVARNPHPAYRYGAVREFNNTTANSSLTDAGIGILVNTDYYHHLLSAIDQATTSIEICMFHIALPDAGHPTQLLLDNLKVAHDRGVTVRVLVDRDRPSDPFESTLINTPSKTWLTDQGIDCRFDKPEDLLHSKFVVIDSRVVIVGSHNWSAGSYFVFDDLSLAIIDSVTVQSFSAKFELLWSQAQ